MGSYEYITWPGNRTTPGPDLFPGWNPSAHGSQVVHGHNGSEWVEVDPKQDPEAFNIAKRADKLRNDILEMVRQDGGRVFYYDGAGFPPLRGYNPGDTARGREPKTGSILVEYRWSGLEWIQQRLTDGMISTLDVGKLTAGTAQIQKAVADTIWAGIIQAKSIVANKITGELIEANTIRGAHIAAGSISADKLQVGTITAESGVIGSLDAGTITTGRLNGQRIAAGSITAAKLAAGAITADSAVVASLDANKIVTGTLNASLIDSDTLKGQTFIGGRFIGGDFLLDPEKTRQNIRFGTGSNLPVIDSKQSINGRISGLLAYDPETDKPQMAIGIWSKTPLVNLYHTFGDTLRVGTQLTPGRIELTPYGGYPGQCSRISAMNDGLRINALDFNANEKDLAQLNLSKHTFLVEGSYDSNRIRGWHLSMSPTNSYFITKGVLNFQAGKAVHFRGTGNFLDGLTVSGGFHANQPKTFVEAHPLDKEKILVHGCTESPHDGIEYWGNETLPASGRMTVSLPDYFEPLHRPDVPVSVFASNGVKVLGPVEGGEFEVEGEAGTWFSWQVKAARRIPGGNVTRAEITRKEAIDSGYLSKEFVEGLTWEP